jgi:hypothetical protein
VERTIVTATASTLHTKGPAESKSSGDEHVCTPLMFFKQLNINKLLVICTRIVVQELNTYWKNATATDFQWQKK